MTNRPQQHARAILVALLFAIAAAVPVGSTRGDDTARARHASLAAEKLWSLAPVASTAVPSPLNSDWAQTGIDRFILARLEQEGLAPADDADRRTLIRRLYFALVGLPPSPEDVAAFLADEAPDALERLVDRLLASPHFGERWGRHWLDVARFAESTGGGRSMLYGTAWRYRDYVVRSFNDDKPFDQFIVEQLAGDLVPSDPLPSTGEARDRLIATAFLALGPTNYELQDKEQLRMDVIDEQIDTTGRAFLGMTLGCARCHDHKFDPVPTQDYYALAGIFRSTKTLIHDNVSTWVQRPLPDERLAEVTDSTMAVEEEDETGDYHVCVRGNVHELGEVAPRGVLTSVEIDGGELHDVPPGTSGRLELARWIASEVNPLTARVIVNRVWHHLFGTGLVRTVDNFGTTGERPSHPELLDHLAGEFVSDGWRIKPLIRRIVLSRTWQQSSSIPHSNDPENRLLSRQNVRRLDAEAVYDSILSLSGSLDSTIGGPTVREGTKSEYGYEFEVGRRAMYMPVFRNQLHGLMAVFDFPDPNLSVGARTKSTLATQALYLMNNPFVLEQATRAAERLLVEPIPDDDARIVLLYERALGRPPTGAELQLARSFVADSNGGEGVNEELRHKQWTQLCQAMIGCIDFRYSH